jgi:hypothetical protein
LEEQALLALGSAIAFPFLNRLSATPSGASKEKYINLLKPSSVLLELKVSK